MKPSRTNSNFSGNVTKGIGRGQKLKTPVGMDHSDKSGGKSKEVPRSMKMGGGMKNLSDTLGRD